MQQTLRPSADLLDNSILEIIACDPQLSATARAELSP
jgi:hypothetical protein